MALAAMLETDHASGAVALRNGDSALTLKQDGQIIVSGVSISQSAERRIAIHAADIDLH